MIVKKVSLLRSNWNYIRVTGIFNDFIVPSENTPTQEERRKKEEKTNEFSLEKVFAKMVTENGDVFSWCKEKVV